MRVQRIGVVRRPNSESPSKASAYVPCVLRIKIDVGKTIRLRIRKRKGLRCRGSDTINKLRQMGVSNGGNRSLREIVVIQTKETGVGSETKFMRADMPRQVIVDKKTRGTAALYPRIVESAQRGEGCVAAASFKDNGENRQSFREIRRTEQALVPGEGGIEVIHQVLREHPRVAGGERIKRLRRNRIEQRIDGIGIGSL